MNIDKFKHPHVKIYSCIRSLRECASAGIVENAREIAALVVSMSSLIKLHLTVEDSVLYPALQASNSRKVAKMGQEYQNEMKGIAKAYEVFARKWNTPESVAGDPEGFRADANTVLKTLFVRVQREDSEFYPAIEAV